ncbi:MAG: tetratricopeptide repeat protein [Pseudomonadota bacterium]
MRYPTHPQRSRLLPGWLPGPLRALSRAALCAGALWLTPTALGAPFDARKHLDESVAALQRGEYALARAYLAPLLPYWDLNNEIRSHIYFLRGQSYYAEGMPVSARKDYLRALEFDAGNDDVRVALGRLYLHGEGVNANAMLALGFLHTAAENGHNEAAFHLGYAHLHALGVEKDLELARYWLGRAAEAGEVNAMTHLASSFRAPYADDPNPAVALRWYDAAIALDHPQAMVAKSYLLRSGELDSVDFERPVLPQPPTLPVRPEDNPIALLERAIELGSTDAQLALGYLHLTGDGVPANAARAFSLIQTAAGTGSPAALLQLGYLHQHGLGTDANAAAAESSYTRAASAGSLPAMLRLGHLLAGDDSPEQRARGVDWLRRAAAGETASAQNQFAWVLATSPHADVRNGDQAVAAAQRAVALDRNASYLDTLAAALAEQGDFSKAVAVQTEALQIADAAEAALSAEAVQELKQHLDSFRNRQPLRDGPG